MTIKKDWTMTEAEYNLITENGTEDCNCCGLKTYIPRYGCYICDHDISDHEHEDDC